MANRRVLIKRRKAARNIRKITRTMQLIATARFQAAFNRATATKPYSRKLAELAADLARAAGEVQHPLLATHDDVARSELVVVTSDRGLAGGYNANVLRAAIAHLEAERAAGRTVRVHMVGKKGINFFRFLRRPMDEQTLAFGDKPRFDQVEPLANAVMDRFLRAEIAAAHVAFMQFHSAGVQRPAVVQLLPLAASGDEAGAAAGTAGGRQIEYEFSPGPAELLDELLPATVRMRLFQAFTDAAVSEQVARMVAMKAATDAAEEMIRALTLQYNRARQTQITMELLDIVGGASALS